jgi:hypothetical protein
MGRTRRDQVYQSFFVVSCHFIFGAIIVLSKSDLAPWSSLFQLCGLPQSCVVVVGSNFLGASVSVHLHGPGFLVILHVLDDLPSSRASAPSLFGRGTPPVILLSCPVVTMPLSSSSTGTCQSAGCAPCVHHVHLVVLLILISLAIHPTSRGDGRCHGCESRRGWVSSVGQPANICRLECQCNKNNIILSEKHTYS